VERSEGAHGWSTVAVAVTATVITVIITVIIIIGQGLAALTGARAVHGEQVDRAVCAPPLWR